MINEAILVGRVGRKESKILNNGGGLTVLSIATDEKFMDSSGERQKKTTWHNVNCFSKLADIAEKYVQVGNILYVRGRINNKKIEQGEREGQYMYSITAQDIRFLPGGSKKEDSPAPEKEYGSTQGSAQENKKFLEDYDSQDIPF